MPGQLESEFRLYIEVSFIIISEKARDDRTSLNLLKLTFFSYLLPQPMVEYFMGVEEPNPDR